MARNKIPNRYWHHQNLKRVEGRDIPQVVYHLNPLSGKAATLGSCPVCRERSE